MKPPNVLPMFESAMKSHIGQMRLEVNDVEKYGLISLDDATTFQAALHDLDSYLTRCTERAARSGAGPDQPPPVPHSESRARRSLSSEDRTMILRPGSVD